MADDYGLNAVITADSSGFKKGIEGAQKALKSFSSSIATVTKSIVGLYAVQNVGQIATSFVKMASSFNDARAEIVKGTGATGKALDDLSKSVENSLLNGVGRSAEEIGKMVADLNTRFAVTGKELEGLVDDFDMFASVTGQTTAQAIESVADVMKKWNVETEYTDELLDQLTVASQASGASVEELENGLKQGQTTFQQFGMSVTKSTAFLATLEKNGIKTSTALAGMRTALVNFTKSGKNAQKAFAEVTEKIKNAKTESEALNIAVDTFGTRAGAEMVQVFRNGGEAVDEMASALMNAKGSLRESEEASRTTQDALDDLKATITALLGGFGGSTALRDTIDAVSESLRSLDMEKITSSVKFFVAQIVNLAGNVATIIVTIYNNFKELFIKLATILNNGTLSFEQFTNGVYDYLDELYLVIQDTFGLIKYLIDGEWAVAWEYAKLIFLRVIKGIVEALGHFQGEIKEKFDLITSVVQIGSLVGVVPKTVSTAIQSANLLFTTVANNSKKTVEKIDGVIEETSKNIENATGEVADVHLKKLDIVLQKHQQYVGDFVAGEIDIQSATEQTAENEEQLLTEWDLKLLKSRLENLEEYSNKYHEIQLQIIEYEREKDLEIESSEEERAKINEYYNNKILAENKRYEEEKQKRAQETLKKIQEGLKKMVDTFKKVFNNIKNIVSKVGNVFTSLFSFNPDEALDNLLKFEDSVLTFFVETLPKLPAFFESAVQSIVVLIQTVLSVIDFNAISNILESIINSVGNLITTIFQFINQNADKLTQGLTQLVSTVIQSVANWVMSGGWKEVLNAVLTIQKMIEKVVTDNIGALVDTIISMLPDLVNTLIASIVSANQTLSKLLRPVLKLVIELVKAIVQVLLSDEVIDASLDVLLEMINVIFDDLYPAIVKLLPKLILKVIASVIKNLPKIVSYLVYGLIKAFATTDWVKVVQDIFIGFIDAFKDLFGIHSPSTLFEGFGYNIIEGLVNGLKGISEAVLTILKPLFDLISNIFEGIGNTIKGVVEISFNGLSTVILSVGNSLEKITIAVTGLVKALGELIDKSAQAVNALNPLSSITGGSSGGVGIGNGKGSVGERIVKGLFTGGLSEIFGFANGSNAVPRGLSIVGEAGPELVKFRGGEQVINNRNTQKLLADANGKTINQSITFNNIKDTSAYAMMNQLKQYNRQMAINGII